MNTIVRRVVTLLVGLVAASLVLSGCLYASIPASCATVARTATPDASGVAPSLRPYYTQSLDWTDCGSGFECTTVTAPLDYENPDAGDVELSVVKSCAGGGAPVGSLLTNPGGPGASGVSFVRDSIAGVAGKPLRDAYDIIGFDPRGVGDSTAVSCFDATAMDDYLFGIVPATRGSDAWTAQIEARNKAFADACDANSGGILPYITTENAARDMDLLRGVLGEDKLDYLGYSYGTFLGATYAKLFPERVGRLVLDGAIDPSVPGDDVGVTQGIGFESALRAYMASCLSGEKCPFRGTVDEAMADLGTLLATVDRAPLEGSDGRMLGADTLMTAIVTPLYSQANWSVLTDMLTDVLQGGADYALSVADLYYSREKGAYTDNSAEAFRAYNCMDYPVSADQGEVDAAYALLDAKAPTIAPYWKGPDACAPWPYPATGVREKITADGAAPIVVIGTTNDPATPYQWAVSLADQLSSGVLLTRVGEGHTGYNKGNSCVDAAVEAYFLDGVVPEDGLRCN